MNVFLSSMILAIAMNGLLSGLNVDTALVKLPARRRIGAVAYATFARGNESSEWSGRVSHFGHRHSSLHCAYHGHCLPGALLDEAALAAFPGFLALVSFTQQPPPGQPQSC